MCATLLLRSFSRKNVSLSASSLFRSFFSKFVVEISLCYSFWKGCDWDENFVRATLRSKTDSGTNEQIQALNSMVPFHFSIPFQTCYHVEKLWQKISLKESYGTHSPLKGAQLFNGPELVIQITNYSNNQIFELGSHHFNETNLIYWSLSQKS